MAGDERFEAVIPSDGNRETRLKGRVRSSEPPTVLGDGASVSFPVIRSTMEWPLPPCIAGRYRPVRFLARGGMGAVYEVVHVNTGEHLAMKLMVSCAALAPKQVLRFGQEARIHGLVRSEHLVRVTDADVAPELDGAPFLIMELLVGMDLERVCAIRRPPPDETVDWLRQIAGALDKAHRLGIVHRDLKPQNLFLARRDGLPDIVKILDFGVAKLVDAGSAAGDATVPGQILGTPRYMAPEQAEGASDVAAEADRFALGLVAYRLLFGRPLYVGDNVFGLLGQAARGPGGRPSAREPSAGPAFDGWFARACAPARQHRFSSCEEQVAALAEALVTDVRDLRPGQPLTGGPEDSRSISSIGSLGTKAKRRGARGPGVPVRGRDFLRIGAAALALVVPIALPAHTARTESGGERGRRRSDEEERNTSSISASPVSRSGPPLAGSSALQPVSRGIVATSSIPGFVVAPAGPISPFVLPETSSVGSIPRAACSMGERRPLPSCVAPLVPRKVDSENKTGGVGDPIWDEP